MAIKLMCELNSSLVDGRGVARSKGAPGLKSRTEGRLVSPAARPKKKKKSYMSKSLQNGCQWTCNCYATAVALSHPLEVHNSNLIMIFTKFRTPKTALCEKVAPQPLSTCQRVTQTMILVKGKKSNVIVQVDPSTVSQN